MSKEEFLREKKYRFDILNDPEYKMIFDKNIFNTPDVYSFQHCGLNIDAVFEDAYEEDNKGYICHRLSLINNDNLVGYLKVFYLPSETFKKMNPDIFHFLDNIKGHSFNLSTHPRKIDANTSISGYWKDKTDTEKQTTLENIGLSFSNNLYKSVLENKDDLTKDQMYKNLLNMANIKTSQQKKQLDIYIKNYIDKPIVEFSKIKSATGDMCQTFWSKNIVKYCSIKNIDINTFGDVKELPFDYRRKGLAQKMYTLMADWLALNKLNLYKGGTNEMSSPLWDIAMKNNPQINVDDDCDNTYINHMNKDLGYLTDKKIIKTKTQKIKTNLS
jgi:hypothetical protein